MNKPDAQIVQQSAAQMAALPATGQGGFLLYQTEDAKTRVQVRMLDVAPELLGHLFDNAGGRDDG